MLLYFIKNNCQLFTFLVFKNQFRLSWKTSPEVTLVVLLLFCYLKPTPCPRAVGGGTGEGQVPCDGTH